MNNITAIGFDLFNTLITVEPETLVEATDRLIQSLRQSGFSIEEEPFKKVYREIALELIARSKQDGRETHNSIWISATLENFGQTVPPDDTKISEAVEHYFSAFYDNCQLIPGTATMLDALKGRYSLGLLSNFTHGPAAREILDRTGLEPYFETILISGELGFRKPYPLVFEKLIKQLGTPKDQILYIGDDLDCDIYGAHAAGLRPVWTTYARDNKSPVPTGMPKRDDREPGIDVPRISSWQDLAPLLETEDVINI
ncbi:HAD family hydrolase [Deltaproteobacteria bacterium]|nr:HAD family hydrolase [Deltaproteobacteria bacterium]